MPNIPILRGIYSDQAARLRTSYPINLEPIITDSGISEGYLRSVAGITGLSEGPGRSRGAIMWNGRHYRVMGSKLCEIAGSSVTVLGDVTDDGNPVSMDYSFDRLAIASGGGLYYWTGSDLLQVTDPDLGTVIDVIWIAGYFMFTDGTFIAVTELNDPMAVDPLKYGSSEERPDPILALRHIRGEIYAINANTIENFQNVGGNGFPFNRNNGGLIPKGCVGTHAVAEYLGTFAYVGGGRNEAPSVWLAGPGQALPMSTPEIDRQLAELTDAELAALEMETIVQNNEQVLLIHLPDKTLAYSQEASRKAEGPVWHIRAGGILFDEPWPARHAVRSAGQWVVGSPSGKVGYLDDQVDTQFGQVAGWQFDTALIYNNANAVLVRALELIGLTGRTAMLPDNPPTMFLSISRDGVVWSREMVIKGGAQGDTAKRMIWRPRCVLPNFGSARFRGAYTALTSIARLEADLEGLSA